MSASSSNCISSKFTDADCGWSFSLESTTLTVASEVDGGDIVPFGNCTNELFRDVFVDVEAIEHSSSNCENVSVVVNDKNESELCVFISTFVSTFWCAIVYLINDYLIIWTVIDNTTNLWNN